MARALSSGVYVSDVACVPEQVLRLAATRWRVATGAFRSSFIITDPQSPLGMGRDLRVSTRVHTVATTPWEIDRYPKGASVNAKCGTNGRSEETATLLKTGSNRQKCPRFVATRVLGEAAEPGAGHQHYRVQNGRR